MEKEITSIDFVNIKKQILRNIDHSKKGSIDTPIVNVLDLINNSNHFVSTSSCSGRIIITSQETLEVQKQNCHWVFSSHDYIDDSFLDSLSEAKGHLTLKFEPFILHVQARTLSSAKALVSVGLSNGFKNSGLVLGKHGKIVVAIRSTSNLEIPLSDGEKLIVSDEFLKYCITILNEKMRKNFDSIRKFEDALAKQFSAEN